MSRNKFYLYFFSLGFLLLSNWEAEAQLHGDTTIDFSKTKNGETNFEVDIAYNISINHDGSSPMHNGNLVQISPTWRVNEENFSYHYQGEDYLLRLFPAYQIPFNPYLSTTKPKVGIDLVVNYSGKSVKVYTGSLSPGHHSSSLLTPSLQDDIRNFIANGGNAEVQVKLKSVTFKTEQFEYSINALLNKLKYMRAAVSRSTSERNITKRYYKEIMNPDDPVNVSVFASDLRDLPVVKEVAEEVIRKQEAIMVQTNTAQNSENDDLDSEEQLNNTATYQTNQIQLGVNETTTANIENKQLSAQHTQQGNVFWDKGQYSEAQHQWEHA